MTGEGLKSTKVEQEATGEAVPVENCLVIDGEELERRMGGYKLVDPKTHSLLATYLYEALLKDVVKELLPKIESPEITGVHVRNFDALLKGRYARYIYSITSAVDLILDKAKELGKPVVASGTDLSKMPHDLQARITKTV